MQIDGRIKKLEDRKPAEKVVFLWDESVPTEGDDDVLYIRFVWEDVPLKANGAEAVK